MLRQTAAMNPPATGVEIDALGWETLSTARFQRQRRLHEWNSFGSETICAMTVDPHLEDFDAEHSHITFGRLGMNVIRSTPAVASALGGDAVAREGDSLLLIVPQRGRCANEQDRQRLEFEPGTMVVRDLMRPWAHSSADYMEVLTVKLPYAELQSRVDDPACLVGYVHSSATPEVAVAIDLLRSVHANLLRASAGPWRDALADLVLDSVAILARQALDPQGAAREKRTQALLRREAMQLICRRLDDPDLSVADVAAAFGVTTRCLQRAFAVTGDSPSAFIQAQRLDRAARMLADGKAGSVLDVAMATGFNDAAHFSRTFARSFGMPPSRYAAGAGRGTA